MHSTSVLPLRTPADVARAVYLCELQAPLRHAESINAEADVQALWLRWLGERLEQDWTVLSGQDWWPNGRARPSEPDVLVAQLNEAYTSQGISDLATSRLIARASMTAFLIAHAGQPIDDDGAVPAPAELIRAVLFSESLGGRPALSLVWPAGESRDPRWDARVVTADSSELCDTPRADFGDASHALIAVIDNAPVDASMAALAAAKDVRVVLELDADAERTYAIARLSALRDLLHLFGSQLARMDEREAVALSFAQIVQQQQTLYSFLDEAGIRLDMSQPVADRQIPAGIAPLEAFRLGVHDVMLEQMRAIKRAQEEGRMVNFGMGVLQALRAQIRALLEAMPGLPGDWLPDARAVRRPMDEVGTHVLGFVEKDGVHVPALLHVSVSQMRDLQTAAPASEAVH